MTDGLPPLRWAVDAPMDLGEAEPLGEGDFCVCFQSDGHVIRLAKHAEASASLERERYLLPRLVPHLPVPVPDIVGRGVREDTGEGFVVYPLLPGHVLEREVLLALDPESRDRLIGRMADFARQLHGVPVGTADGCGLETMSPREDLPRMMAAADRELADRVPDAVLTYHHDLLAEYLAHPALHQAQLAILHGDLSPGHFLADLEAGELTGILDFGDAFIGDPYRDLIFILEDYGSEVLDAFLAHYAPDDPDAARRVRILQELDNVAYALGRLAASDGDGITEALWTLARQADEA